MISISEYDSADKTRHATISKNNKDEFILELYENNELVHTITYTDKSLRFVEDAAENFVERVFNNYKDF